MGNLVGYELNGQKIIRSLPAKNKRKPSALTLLNRQRMAAVSQFLRPLRDVLRFGYRAVAPPGSRIGPFQAAQSHTFKNALDYHPENIPYVNPEKVLVFRGPLPAPEGTALSRINGAIQIEWNTQRWNPRFLFWKSGKPGRIRAEWSKNNPQLTRINGAIQIEWNTQNCHAPEVLIALAYEPNEQYVFFAEGIARAEEGSCRWEIDPELLNKIPHLHVYLGFYNIRSGTLSDSVYAGCS